MLIQLRPKLTEKHKATPLWYIMATWFYAGRLKPASGTWGTLASLPLLYLMAWFVPLPNGVVFIGFSILTFLIGLWVCHHYLAYSGEKDPSAVVIDEVSGMSLVFAFLPDPMHWAWCTLGFILFRLFDALKPWPISYFDKNIAGPLGIMLDDIIAAIGAGIVILLTSDYIREFLPYVF